MTRLLVTSRPYLVGQRFTTDTGTVYDDSAADDGAFVPHMASEVVKVHETLLGIPTSSIQVEAHPKIKSNPFLGAYEFHLFVKPPAPSPVAQHGPLAVAFQFVVRQGCTVTVKAAPGDTVELLAVALHLRSQELSLRHIAARLVIATGRKKGQHPSPATVMRMLRDHDEKVAAMADVNLTVR